MKKRVADACFLVSAVRSSDLIHWGCYNYLKNHEDDDWIIPAIAYFEYQAVQSRLASHGKSAFRELFMKDHWRIYDLTHEFIVKSGLDTIELFPMLRGADLIYACIAKVESASLVTCDFGFDVCSNYIDVVNPLRDHASWWHGDVVVEVGGARYVGHYKVAGALPMLTLISGSASISAQLGNSLPKGLARC